MDEIINCNSTYVRTTWLIEHSYNGTVIVLSHINGRLKCQYSDRDHLTMTNSSKTVF